MANKEIRRTERKSDLGEIMQNITGSIRSENMFSDNEFRSLTAKSRCGEKYKKAGTERGSRNSRTILKTLSDIYSYIYSVRWQ